jgi:DUF3089 family protein
MSAMLKPLLLALGAAALSVPAAVAQTPTAAAPQETARPAPNDYSSAKTWLCRPGRTGAASAKDACDVDMTATSVAANGKLTREPWTADANAPIDCFYVYPTVSTDAAPNSDMTPDPAELNVVRQQFARFASKCRPYAPMYRQVTLAGLRAMMGGGGAVSLDRGLAYNDVRDAWRSYVERDNKGRGFVLIGHSQGSFILAELIRQEIDGKPIQSRMVSAILLGTTIAVPRGKDVGGTFQHVPLCRAASQTGCLITFASFRSTIPPPPNTLFGKVGGPNLVGGNVHDEGMIAACTNPAALGGGSGALRAYLDAKGQTITSTPNVKPWVVPEQPIETPWVSVPGLLTAQCASNDNATYLEVTVHGDPSDPRVDDITGDIGTPPQVLANWGLHLIDVNLAMGDLVDIVGRQAKAYRPTKSTKATK